MKLGKPKIVLLKVVGTVIFMCFITILTINYLYSTCNLTKNEYFNLLLSDTYGNNFYINLVEIINQNFKPLNIIEIKEKEYNTFSLVNTKIDDPIVYIYNSNEEINDVIIKRLRRINNCYPSLKIKMDKMKISFKEFVNKVKKII